MNIGQTGKIAIVAGSSATMAAFGGVIGYSDAKDGRPALPLVGGGAAVTLGTIYALAGRHGIPHGDFGGVGVGAMIGGLGVGAVVGALIGAAQRD